MKSLIWSIVSRKNVSNQENRVRSSNRQVIHFSRIYVEIDAAIIVPKMFIFLSQFLELMQCSLNLSFMSDSRRKIHVLYRPYYWTYTWSLGKHMHKPFIKAGLIKNETLWGFHYSYKSAVTLLTFTIQHRFPGLHGTGPIVVHLSRYADQLTSGKYILLLPGIRIQRIC